MAVFGYCRVSTQTAGQRGRKPRRAAPADRGLRAHARPAARRRACRGRRQRLDPGRKSGRSAARCSPSSRSGDVVIAPKLDRLFRSALDALKVVEDLKSRGVKLHLLDLGGDIAGNGLSKLFLTIAAAFAEAERDRIRERIGQVKADQKARGRYLGGKVPFGFRRGDDGELVPHEAEQEAIREMVALRAQGRALRAIAEAMRAKGHRISHEGVAGVIRGTALLLTEAEAAPWGGLLRHRFLAPLANNASIFR